MLVATARKSAAVVVAMLLEALSPWQEKRLEWTSTNCVQREYHKLELEQ